MEQLNTLHTQRSYARQKRLLDLVLAAFTLLLAGLPMLIIALGIRLDSPGPALYRQRRIGRGGRPFEMLKFRTMHPGSDRGPLAALHREHARRLIREDVRPEDLGQPSLKLQADPRVTGPGRLLRRTSLDELPQLFNVLRGEMSLVGPRPPLPYEYELYAPRDRLRMCAAPGMTGLWQVTARNAVSFSEMVRLDLEYIERMSLGLDLLILLKTPLAVLSGRGAG